MIKFRKKENNENKEDRGGGVTIRELTEEEITSLAHRKGVKTIAVENFLMSLGNAGGIQAELANLRADAQSYGWKKPTVTAIEIGIKKAYGVIP